MKRIGILGGTFDPIHIGHEELAKRAYEELQLDKVYVIPSGQPPYKDNSLISPAADRLNMVREAFSDVPYVIISDMEIKRPGDTYTVDTLTELAEDEPDSTFYLILGKDAYSRFPDWRDSARIKELATPVCYDRSSISSKLIRDRISCGMPTEGFLSPSVRRYADDHGLYLNSRYEAIKASLRSLLNPHRYEHTLGVAQTAFTIAEACGFDVHRAYLAGLLHDCAKHMSDEDLIREAENHGETLTAQEIKYPNNLLHSKAGSYRANEIYGIEDREILDSIYYHTSGRANMSLLEKIIYISDFIEPGRKINIKPSLSELRSQSLYDLEGTFKTILKHTTEYLLETYKNDVCSETLSAYKYYCE